MRQLVIGILLLLLLPGVNAKEAAPLADDPVMEARMLELAKELRCLVCQNQSLADSHSGLAGDMRREIRELMQQGKTDKEIVDYLVNRYGDFVRYRPPVNSSTLLLWFGPFALLTIGAGLLAYTLRQRGKQVTARGLTEEERRQVNALIEREDEKKT